MDSNNILKDLVVVKRSGQRVSFNGPKIAIAIKRAFDSVYENYNEKNVNVVYEKVLQNIETDYINRKTINVEEVQDIIEKSLHDEKYIDVYKSFSEYRLRRAASREVFSIKQQHKFVKAIEKLGYTVKQNNANKPNEMLDKFGKTISKEFATSYLIDNKIVRAFEEGRIYVNDLKTYSLGNTSSSHLNSYSIPGNTLNEYFNNVINTVLLCKKDQYKEHTLINFDSALKRLLLNDYKNLLKDKFLYNLKINGIYEYFNKDEFLNLIDGLDNIEDIKIKDKLKNEQLKLIYDLTYEDVINNINHDLQNNIKRLFSILSMNIETDYKKLVICLDNDGTKETKIIINNYFKVLSKLNNIITNIYISDDLEINTLISKAIKDKKIVHLLFEKNKEINYFSNGEKIYENVNDEISTSRGRTINSTVTINLARIALKNSNIKDFYEDLDYVMELSKNALIQRYEIQANKYKENYNILFDSGLLFDSEKLDDNQKVRKVIRNGTMFIGYSGLVEASLLLNNNEEKLNEKDYTSLINIVKYMNNKCKEFTKDVKLNFNLCEVYDDSIIKEFIKIDKTVFGLKKIINKEKYEPFYKTINNLKLDIKDIILKQVSYQKYTSSIIKIYSLKNNDEKSIIKLINTLKENGAKYASIEVSHDN